MSAKCVAEIALEPVCSVQDLVPDSGVAVLYRGKQVALFYLPDMVPKLYALCNFDPIGQAHVLSRGIVGDVRGELVVASPLYKQHFSLITGKCTEEPDICVRVYPAALQGDQVLLGAPA